MATYIVLNEMQTVLGLWARQLAHHKLWDHQLNHVEPKRKFKRKWTNYHIKHAIQNYIYTYYK